MKIRTLISDKILIPFIKPVMAEMTKAATMVIVMKIKMKSDSRPKMLFKPPESVRIPAPSDAAIPATKAYKQIPSIPMPNHLCLPDLIKG